MSSSNSDAAPFLQYHEPEIVDILILVSFFTFLWLAEYVSAKTIRAGIIGPIAVGIIYGEPLANILQHDWAAFRNVPISWLHWLDLDYL